MVSQESMSANWHSIVGKVKEKFGQITGDDLTKIQGNVDQLVGLIERKTGQTREQVEEFLQGCCDTTSDTYRKVAERSQKMIGQASDMIDEGIKQVSDRANEGYEYAKETVSRRPAESLAVVAGLGLLAGFAIGMSMCSRK
jgi:uncharacterized protein YjbJ (UPF0337 family)